MTHLHCGAFGAGSVVPAFSARQAQCIAVDRQRVQQHLGVIAIGFGALQVSAGVPDQSPVAMRRVRRALTAAVSHGPLLASPRGAIPMPRRGP